MSRIGPLELVADVVGLLDIDEFHAGLMGALRRAVPADWVSLNDISDDPAETVVLIDPPFPAESHEIYARHAFDNPLLARYMRTADGGAYRFSDVASAAELRATALYQKFYGPIGLRHQIAFTLAAGRNRVLAVALSRRHHDFSDDERDLLNAARPLLTQSLFNAVEHSKLQVEIQLRSHGRRLPLTDEALATTFARLEITTREAEVLSWAATGRTHRAVASLLGVSERTVHKHLENCFTKLGVHSRAEALAVAWQIVGSRELTGSILSHPSDDGRL